MGNNHNDSKVRYERFIASVNDALTDLATLEVNSVLVYNISADHPSDDKEFLVQTSVDLADWFEANKTDGRVQLPLSKNSLDPLKDIREKGILEKKGDKNVVRDLKATSEDIKECIEHPRGKLDDAESLKRAEYRRHLRYLQKFVELHNSPNWAWSKDGSTGMLSGREHQQLRKLWELVATDFVYAQTVVGLDGDVISRVNQQLFNNAQKIVSDNAEKLIHFHSRNVETGASYRNSLMVSLLQIVKGFLGR